MKPLQPLHCLCLLSSLLVLPHALHAQQVTVQPVQPAPAPTVVVEPVQPAPAAPTVVVEEVVRPVVEVLDPVVVRQQLSIAPKVVVVPAPAPPAVTTVPAPSAAAIEAFNNRPRRVYNEERKVVVVEEQAQSRELPYVTIPVLFEKETAKLLDAESRASLEQVASVILEVSKTEAGARFEIEGHTSTDGADDFNMDLSVARAKRVYDELTKRYGVPPELLKANGYGENFPMHPKGTEAQMQQDRRVLVVRTS